MESVARQLSMTPLLRTPTGLDLEPAEPLVNGKANRLQPRDRAFHDWYRFVLSFPPHLVRHYIQGFHLSPGQVVLDPFCGTATTLIEARHQAMRSIGLEANPFAAFASRVKLDWEVDPELMTVRAAEIGQSVRALLQAQGIDDCEPFGARPINAPLRTLESEAERLILANSISPLPLHKTLALIDSLREHRNERYYEHMRLALANALVSKIGNLHFGPEVGVGKAKKNAPVVACWLAEVHNIASDLRLVAGKAHVASTVCLADARRIGEVLDPQSVDAVITSPPYPNEKDYTRTTRLESVLLGFITSRAQLREQKQEFLRSNTRGVYKGDDDDEWVAGHQGIQAIAAAIERRRCELGKESGFERLYGRVTRLYFGGMARHLAQLRTVLRPGAKLAYVVGDQASYLRVMIRTGQLLAEIAEALGYQAERIDLFRTRFSTATKEQLREEVVVLRWNGSGG